MKATIVTDESLQPNIPFLSHKGASDLPQFPVHTAQSSNKTESYSTVIQQAIITQDKPLLQQILLQSTSKQLVNSIDELNPSKISSFLLLLQQFLHSDSRHTLKYSSWIKQIMLRHLGMVLANSANKQAVARVRKFVHKRINQRQSLLNLRACLGNAKPTQQQKEFVPKFTYVESKEKQEDKIEIEEQDWAEEDLMMDEFDE